MANDCFYDMHVKGREEDVNELYSMLCYEHPKGYHFYRIFDVYAYDKHSCNDGRVVACFSGDCAWSAFGCFFNEGFSDYSNDVADIINESKRLHLDIEVFSEELGMAFQEHFRVNNGSVLVEEDTDYRWLVWDKGECPTFADFKEAYDIPDDVTVDDLIDGDAYAEGGFEWDWAVG